MSHSTSPLITDASIRDVLIVEDDLPTAERERRTLAGAGLTAHLASSTRDAKFLLQQRLVQAVVLNYKLPDGDPWEIVELAHSQSPRIPVVLVSAMGDERSVAEAMHRGVSDYIHKSDAFWEQLAATIDRVVKQARAEKELLRNDALLQMITEHAGDLIIAIDARAAIRYLSPACRTMLGYEASDLLDKPFLELVHPDDRSRFETISYFQAQSRRVTFRCCRRDRALLWVEADFQPIRDAKTGLVLEVLGILRDITERKLTEERLKQSEEQFRGAFETAPHGMALVSTEGRWLRVNQALCHMLGYTRDEFLSLDFQTITHPDDLEADLNLVLRLLRGEIASYQMEKRYFHKGGQVVQALLSVSLVRDANRQPVHFVSQVLDITERKRVENGLRTVNEALEEKVETRTREVRMQAVAHETKNRRLRLLAKAADQLLLNEAFEAALPNIFDDLAAELGVERYSYYVIDPANPARLVLAHSAGLNDEQQQALNHLEVGQYLSGAVAQSSASLVLENVQQRSDALTATARAMGLQGFVGHPLMAHGRLLGTLGFWSKTRSHFEPDEVALMRTLCDQVAAAMDRARLLDEAHAAEERFRRVVEWAPYAMVMLGPSGNIDMLNRQAESVFGYPRQEVLGRSVELLVPERFRDSHSEFRTAFFNQPRPRTMGSGPQLLARRKDGSEFPVEVALSPFDAKEGRMVLSAIIDISERRAAEAHIQAALREKDLLLAEIHHRVKNNLQIIDSLLSLQSASLVDEGALGLVQESRNRVKSMAMIHQTLYESNNFEAVDFARFLESLVSMLVSSYSNDAARIRVSINASDVMLPISVAVPCGLVANELVSNALKHAFAQGQGGEIRIELSRERTDQARLAVTDNGAGVPERFDLEAATTLGLQLVTELAAQLGGSLTIQRAKPTQFELLFPIQGVHRKLQPLPSGTYA